MSEKELLNYYLDIERNTMFRSAADYRMDRAKAGMETMFQAAQARADLLVDMLGRMGQA